MKIFFSTALISAARQLAEELAPDLEEACSLEGVPLSNYDLMESVLDADRLAERWPVAYAESKALFKAHGFPKVVEALSKVLPLV